MRHKTGSPRYRAHRSASSKPPAGRTTAAASERAGVGERAWAAADPAPRAPPAPSSACWKAVAASARRHALASIDAVSHCWARRAESAKDGRAGRADAPFPPLRSLKRQAADQSRRWKGLQPTTCGGSRSFPRSTPFRRFPYHPTTRYSSRGTRSLNKENAATHKKLWKTRRPIARAWGMRRQCDEVRVGTRTTTPWTASRAPLSPRSPSG